jgi:D-xylulose reductase
MKAAVLEKKQHLSLRDFPIEETLGPADVRISIRVVGICGSDVHYYQHGQIGPFVVKEPLILGHEAAGVVTETGSAVSDLRVGDRVCMEPGYPESPGRITREGMYNLDPSIRFWATPPVHGCLRPEVVHPANFTYRLPDSVSFEEGAMVEPLAVGMHAATKARIRPGDVALVTGAGPIGMLTALAALAGGCSQVFITDVIPEKLELAASLGAITPIDVTKASVKEVIDSATDGWGVDCIFESSGSPAAFGDLLDVVCPGGCLVLVGMPPAPVPFDVVAAQVKEVRIEHVFRYAHVFQRALALMGSGQLDVKPLITDTFSFEDSVAAFDFASAMPPRSVKAQIAVTE